MRGSIPRRLPAVTLLVAAFGLALGSFLNAADVRAESDEDFVRRLRAAKTGRDRIELCTEALAAAASSRSADFKTALSTGYLAIWAGDDSFAVATLETIARPEFDVDDELRAEACLFFAETFVVISDDERASELYREALEIRPDDIEILHALGQSLLRRGVSEDPALLNDALDVFERMTDLRPEDAVPWSYRAEALDHLGFPIEAVGMLERALERSPNNLHYLDWIGSLYLEQGDTLSAEEVWSGVVTDSTTYGPSAAQWASLRLRQKKPAEAQAILELASSLEAAPWHLRLVRQHGFLSLSEGELDAARDRFKSCVGLERDALALLGRAHVHLLRSESADAVAVFEEALAVDSLLAVPFIAAWKGPLAAFIATSAADTTVAIAAAAPRLRRALDAPGSISIPEGSAATSRLCEFATGCLQREVERSRMLRQAGLEEWMLSSLPVLVDIPPAEYPEIARRAGIEGMVAVRALIDETGNVLRTEIEDSGGPNLDRAAITATLAARFEPALHDGLPVRAWVVLPFRFDQDDSKPGPLYWKH